MKETIEHFCDTISNYFKFDYTVKNRFKLSWKLEDIITGCDKVGLMHSLYLNSNIKNAPTIVNEFHFLLEEKDNERFFIFGTNSDGFDYAVDKATGEIVLVDYEGIEIYFGVAKDELSFLKVLIKLREFDSLFAKGKKVEAAVSKKFREECIELAGGNKYSKLYKFIVISEDDQPDELFTLP